MQRKENQIKMDTSELPLVKNCMNKAAEYESVGDKVNAEKWFRLAVLAEKYYSEQSYKTMEEIFKEKYGTT
jgi:hypothetical protein